ncbi:hypothetical protein INH39_19450 [Massilia violaceinigra]|uniref:GAPS4 PD-(D/E)XK nuclease domain-containing protein n=1 Tax=Massilia violaceinigra TaxID=2045208 RepID=A0ABY3ZZ19_9BURK|nr:hypothetical protein [Massilia violaceinigra]UOD27676.1 hypothetical protein INH39_19450 [Massilia violaceinigra]
MAETVNTAEIAKKISSDIFNVFHWHVVPQEDANFECVLEHHLTKGGDKKKSTHPCDAIFYYLDPYLNKVVYFHTDLKSYAKSSIQIGKVREALNSLAMTVECAHVSTEWKKKFPRNDDENFDIRGLLFVANHDNKAPLSFGAHLSNISKSNLNIAKDQILHVLGPKEISELYSVATDIKLLIFDKKLPPLYRFFYPDLTLWKRHTTDDQRTAATIETLMSPYFILKHEALKDDTGEPIQRPGCIVYYSRNGATVEEFIYLLDSLLRFQLVSAKEQVRIRVFNRDIDAYMKNNFAKAKERYCQSWGFDGDRESEIKDITIDAISKIEPNYSPDDMGWKNK